MNELSKQQQSFQPSRSEGFTVSLEIRTGPEDGRSLVFATPRVLIGRQPSAPDAAAEIPVANFVIRTDKSISREHCQLTIESPQTLILEDLNSRFGTFLNGTRITESVKCHAGDAIKIGDTEILVR